MRRPSEQPREYPSHAAVARAGGAGAGPGGGHPSRAQDADVSEGTLALAAGAERDTPPAAVAPGDRRERSAFWSRPIGSGTPRSRRAAASASTEAVWLGATPVYLVSEAVDGESDTGTRRLALGLKRGVDVVGATLGLCLVAPFLLVLACLVRLDSRGPALFAHARVGRGGRVFRCYKLRTMRQEAESLLRTDPTLRAEYERNGFKVPHAVDPRITRLGRVLRLTSCDELPQLWNVLRGEMSLVGPRPLVARELAHYVGADRDLLLSVRPGLTGAWAVAGRSTIGYPRRAAIELAYVRDWSMSLDLAILLRTVGTVIGRRGAS